MSTVIDPSPKTRTDSPVAGNLPVSSPPVAAMAVSPAQAADEGRQINWAIVGWLAIIHLGALAAPLYFSWSGLALVVVLHWITGGLGVCLCYHRLLTHQSFSTFRPVRWLLAVIGSLSGEGSALEWTATHRKHHALSDQPGDPHSPRDGAWWSHIFWLTWGYSRKGQQALLEKWAPDLLRDRGLRVISHGFLLWNVLFGTLIFAAGWLIGGAALGTSWLVWGVFLRLVLVLHSTWFVNSASHIWGYRNYITQDDSRNLWWVALLTYGEGWHNNHHAFPRMAAHGHRWWEFDMTYFSIRVLERLGLAWNVVHQQRGARK